MNDIRNETLNRCYEIAGYKDLPIKEKNEIYDRMKEKIELERSAADVPIPLHCDECPYNNGFSAWPENRKPCGNFRCLLMDEYDDDEEI